MAQSVRTRLLRMPKVEQEVPLNTRPSGKQDTTLSTPLVPPKSKTPSMSSISSAQQRARVSGYDYEAPLTAHTLRPSSRWLIVRRNLHRIRFMGLSGRERDATLPSFYLGLQMKRELKRAQEEIKHIDQEANFHAVKRFVLAISPDRTKTYNTSHVKPDDALIYDRLGEEPLALQNLLYYFSKQEVPHGTLFWDFLNGVNHVLNMKRRRNVRVERLRKLALVLAIIFYSIIGLMFLLLLISVITTATKMNDPEVLWTEKVERGELESIFQP